MLNIQITGDKEIIAKLDKIPSSIHRELLRTITDLALDVQEHVVSDKLQGQVLNHITGQLASSIHNSVQDSAENIIGRIYSSGVNYAAIHEYGFHGSETVREHIRTHLFGKEVAPFTVPSYTRNVNMPERSFLRSSLKDFQQRIVDDMTKAVGEAIQ